MCYNVPESQRGFRLDGRVEMIEIWEGIVRRMDAKMKLDDIRVPERFLDCRPGEDKIKARKKQARKKPLQVAVNKDGWLTDMYASYIAARELGHDEILVVPGRDVCTAVGATFRNSDKEYVWIVSDRLLSGWAERGIELKPGVHLAVPSPAGAKHVRVTRVFEVPFPSEHAEIIGMWSTAKYQPEKYAEYVRIEQGIAAYCLDHNLRTLEEFIAAAENDMPVRHLYQFATGKWASEGRRNAIRRAIVDAWRGSGGSHA